MDLFSGNLDIESEPGWTYASGGRRAAVGEESPTKHTKNDTELPRRTRKDVIIHFDKPQKKSSKCESPHSAARFATPGASPPPSPGATNFLSYTFWLLQMASPRENAPCEEK